MHIEGESFLAALAANVGKDERLIACGFMGDPNTAPPNAWRPRPWAPGRDLDLGDNWNGYVTVATFGRAPDGSFRRRTDTFCAGQALMVDDVGTKVDPGVVSGAQPSAVVETSPGNFQWWYFLDRPCRDREKFDALIRAFIYGQLLGNDPGMNGVNRVGRIPGYVNGKAQHNGWRCRLTELNERRWSVEDIVSAFKLQLQGRRVAQPMLRTELAQERARGWAATMGLLRQLQMVKRSEPDPSGWSEIHCPWIDWHTNRADTGAAVRRPHEDNGWYGAFRCHHGHCGDKAWADLTEWVSDAAVGLTDGINSSPAVELYARAMGWAS